MPTRRFSLMLPQRRGAPGRGQLEISAEESLWLPKRLSRHGLADYEPETMACFLAAIDRTSSGHVLDVGANVGVFAWLAASVLQRESIAFEPNPEPAACAAEVAQANALPLTVERMALGEAPGEAILHVSAISDMSSSLVAGFRPARQKLRVAVDSMDAYCERNNVSPAVLKIDTECTEPAVLRGAQATLKKHRPWFLCEVLGSGEAEAGLMELTEPLGYHWYQVTKEVPLVHRREIFGDRSGTFRNWLFTPAPPSDRYWQRVRYYQRALAACRPPRLPRTWKDDLSKVSPGLGRLARKYLR